MNDAQDVPATDDARFSCILFRNWKWLVDPWMRASGMVVIDICAQDTPQMSQQGYVVTIDRKNKLSLIKYEG